MLGAYVGYHIAMLALGGALLTSAIAAVVGAAVVLFGSRMAKQWKTALTSA